MFRRKRAEFHVPGGEPGKLAFGKSEIIFSIKNILWICAMWMAAGGGFWIAYDSETLQISQATGHQVPKTYSSQVCAPSIHDTMRGYNKAIAANDAATLFTYFATDYEMHFDSSEYAGLVVVLHGTSGFMAFADWWISHFEKDKFPTIEERKFTHVSLDESSNLWTTDFHWNFGANSFSSAREVHMFTQGNCIWRTYTHLMSDFEGLPPGRIVRTGPMAFK
eukprot:GEMP01054085.1.p1 GENE.GEMP01054085.1~~GEMP01054085.1.p1  ORF type:complete len:221 (+),score=30.25 GEMP01054085.1:204-866(+)